MISIWWLPIAVFLGSALGLAIVFIVEVIRDRRHQQMLEARDRAHTREVLARFDVHRARFKVDAEEAL